MYSYGPPHMAVQKQDDQHEHTFSSYVRIRDVVLKTYLGRWTLGRSGERGSGISVLPERYDDDDDIPVYMCIQTKTHTNREREREREREKERDKERTYEEKINSIPFKMYVFTGILWVYVHISMYAHTQVCIDIHSHRRCLWCNGYRRRKWTRRHEFKSGTRLIAYHIALIPFRKVWIQLFSLQLWVNSRADYVLQPWGGN